MAKEFLHKEGLTKLVENIKAWCKGAFLGKDATITKSSGTNKGVSVSIQGSVSEPSVSVSVTTGGVSKNNSGIVSGVEVKTYVDENAATKDTFKAATSSSNAVNGLVPAPSSANATKFLRGDGTWATSPLATNDTDGLMSATDKVTLDQSVAMVTPMTGDDGSCVLEVERNDGTYLEFPVPKVGSAKEADNALNLGGTPLRKIHEYVSYNDKLFGDTEGWYRIVRSVNNSANPKSLILFLARHFANDSPESYVFSISNTMGDYFSITQLSGVASVRLIDKIRVVNSASTTDYIYVDIHINPSSGKQNRVYWGVVGDAVTYNANEVVFNPELTGANVELETVNGFKTNGYIYEGSSSLSEKYAGKSDLNEVAFKKDLNNLIFNSNTNQLPIGADLNDYTVVKGKAGLWRAQDNTNYTNAPIANFGLAVIKLNSNYSAQILMPMDPLGKGIYYRSTYWAPENPDALSAWKLIPFATNVISASASNKGVSVVLGGTVGAPTVSVTTTTGGVSAANSGVVSGAEVKDYLETYTAPRATTADSANAIGGKGLNDLVQGGGTIKFIKVVTSLPASPSNDTLYLIKQ